VPSSSSRPRNIAAHTTEEWPEQIALEMLAVLSTVARWADDTRDRHGPVVKQLHVANGVA
jgi:hypothetical protein